MMNRYDPKLPLAYSPGERFKHVQDTRRDETIGGLTTVLRRMINLADDCSPPASRFTATGEKFSYFGFFDFNAMYPACMRKEMPLTAGLEWTIKEVTFYKSYYMVHIVFLGKIHQKTNARD